MAMTLAVPIVMDPRTLWPGKWAAGKHGPETWAEGFCRGILKRDRHRDSLQYERGRKKEGGKERFLFICLFKSHHDLHVSPYGVQEINTSEETVILKGCSACGTWLSLRGWNLGVTTVNHFTALRHVTDLTDTFGGMVVSLHLWPVRKRTPLLTDFLPSCNKCEVLIFQ